MEPNIEFLESERRRKRAKKIFVVVVVVLLLILASGSYGGFRMHEKFLSEEREKVDSIQNVLDTRDNEYQIRFQEGIDSVQKLNVKEDDYYDEMVRYYNLSERLQEELDFIYSLNISHPRLDSLAKHIKYPRRNRKN